jgi:predicted nucleic acid-binding protein
LIRAVIDCNAVDKLPEHYEAVRAAVDAGDLDLLWTHVTVDELAAITDADRRAWLLAVAASICRFVATGAFVVGFSRLNMARLGDDAKAFDAYRNGNLRHTRDALVAVTAEFECAAVVTYDNGMKSRAEARGLTVYAWPSLLAAIKVA